MSETGLTIPDNPDYREAPLQYVYEGNLPDGGDLTPEEEVERLRQLLAEKDHAVIQAVTLNAEAQQELETSRAEALALRAELEIVKENPDAAAAPVVSEEIVKITAQFRHAQKVLEREQGMLRSELVTVKARFQQAQAYLETERRARRAEASRAQGKIAALEQDLSVAHTSVADSGKAGDRERAIRVRLSAAAVVAALIVAGFFGWQRLPASSVTAPADTASAPVAAKQDEAPQTAPAVVPGSLLTSQSGFQGALSNLNIALANYPERKPEDVLAEVRKRMGSKDPTLCAFEWNGGQPALMYGGKTKTVSLATTLGRCAQAVEIMRMQ
jgi:hypothetical protein